MKIIRFYISVKALMLITSMHYIHSLIRVTLNVINECLINHYIWIIDESKIN